MAVPKKRTSKAKKNQRKTNWKKKAVLQAEKYNAIGKLRNLKIKDEIITVDKEKLAKKNNKKIAKQEAKLRRKTAKQAKMARKRKRKNTKANTNNPSSITLQNKTFFLPDD